MLTKIKNSLAVFSLFVVTCMMSFAQEAGSSDLTTLKTGVTDKITALGPIVAGVAVAALAIVAIILGWKKLKGMIGG